MLQIVRYTWIETIYYVIFDLSMEKSVMLILVSHKTRHISLTVWKIQQWLQKWNYYLTKFMQIDFRPDNRTRKHLGKKEDKKCQKLKY